MCYSDDKPMTPGDMWQATKDLCFLAVVFIVVVLAMIALDPAVGR